MQLWATYDEGRVGSSRKSFALQLWNTSFNLFQTVLAITTLTLDVPFLPINTQSFLPDHWSSVVPDPYRHHCIHVTFFHLKNSCLAILSLLYNLSCFSHSEVAQYP